MTMQSKLVLVGVEHIDGAKSSYAMCAFAQGADVCKFMVGFANDYITMLAYSRMKQLIDICGEDEV